MPGALAGVRSKRGQKGHGHVRLVVQDGFVLRPLPRQQEQLGAVKEAGGLVGDPLPSHGLKASLCTCVDAATGQGPHASGLWLGKGCLGDWGSRIPILTVIIRDPGQLYFHPSNAHEDFWVI